MQFAVPLIFTAGVFGALGGAAQQTAEGGQLWLQNAGFVWAPFIIASSLLAWFGMNAIAAAKASFAEQEIGRGSCRERGCKEVVLSVVAGLLKKKKHQIYSYTQNM